MIRESSWSIFIRVTNRTRSVDAGCPVAPDGIDRSHILLVAIKVVRKIASQITVDRCAQQRVSERYRKTITKN